MTLLLGLAGLAIDIGRMYVIRAELQAFTDAAALSAALQLNGTDSGLARARAARPIGKWSACHALGHGHAADHPDHNHLFLGPDDVAGAAQAVPAISVSYAWRHRAGARDLPEGFSAAHVHHGRRGERGREDGTIREVDAMSRRTQAGSALIEFAGSLILLSVMFSGIFEIGYSFYTYSELVTAVRAGARYAALQPRESAANPVVAEAVRNLVVYGDPAPDIAPNHYDEPRFCHYSQIVWRFKHDPNRQNKVNVFVPIDVHALEFCTGSNASARHPRGSGCWRAAFGGAGLGVGGPGGFGSRRRFSDRNGIFGG